MTAIGRYGSSKYFISSGVSLMCTAAVMGWYQWSFDSHKDKRLNQSTLPGSSGLSFRRLVQWRLKCRIIRGISREEPNRRTISVHCPRCSYLRHSVPLLLRELLDPRNHNMSIMPILRSVWGPYLLFTSLFPSEPPYMPVHLWHGYK